MNSFWLPPDFPPILIANVFINFNRYAAIVKRIAASTFRAGNPIILAGFDAVIIGFKPSTFETLECLTPIVERAASFGKSDAPNPCVARQTAGLALNIHDASCLCRCLRGWRREAAARGRIRDGLLQVCRLSAARFWHGVLSGLICPKQCFGVVMKLPSPRENLRVIRENRSPYNRRRANHSAPIRELARKV
jgi:hypothetical protein